MSVHYSSAVWKIKMQNAGRKLVVLALADMSNDDGLCWPSVRCLSERCSLRMEAIRDHLAAIEKEGMVTRQARFNDRWQTSNLFQFCSLEMLSKWNERTTGENRQ
jgi:hypothetical protein